MENGIRSNVSCDIASEIKTVFLHLQLKLFLMENKDRNSKASRGGDTQRTSSQGQKFSSGGKIPQREKGAPEKDETNNSELRDQKPPRRRRS
jgi:hypothetical protein